ncbi:MAG TPA: polysaccharide biosynthesis C-terminal domain-containing protein, partial [Ignavibacteria bacterium]|nr:polysaccharide biosynthesis C-terminal domain-containing protein [Ignavibacteria bacterium]
VLSFSGLIINVILNFVLIPNLGMTGAALATLLTYFSMALILYYYSQKIYQISYDWKKIGKLMLICFIVFIAGYFVLNRLDLPEIVILILNVVLLLFYLFLINNQKIIELRKIRMLWNK